MPRLTRADGVAAVERVRRARILVGGCLAGFVASCLFFAHRLATSGLSQAWVMLWTALAFALPPWLVRRGWLRLAGAIVPAALLLLLPFDAYQNGGLAGASLTAMLVVPLMAGFFVDARAAFLAALALVLETLAFLVLTRIGWAFPPTLEPTRAAQMQAFAVCVLLPFVAGLVALFDRERAVSARLLTEGERRFALAAEETNDGIFEWRPLLDRVRLSRRYGSLVGEPLGAEPTLQGFLGTVHAADRAALERGLCDIARQGGRYEQEYRVTDGKGSYRWLEGKAFAERPDDDAGAWVLGSVRDVTERKRLAQLKDEFVATVSHELRTPVTIIRGSLGLIRAALSRSPPCRSIRSTSHFVGSKSV